MKDLLLVVDVETLSNSRLDAKQVTGMVDASKFLKCRPISKPWRETFEVAPQKKRNPSNTRQVIINACQDENRIGEHKGRRIETLETSTFDLHLETRDVKVAIRLTFAHGVTLCLDARNIMVVLEMSDMSKLSDSHSNAKEVLPTIDARPLWDVLWGA